MEGKDCQRVHLAYAGKRIIIDIITRLQVCLSAIPELLQLLTAFGPNLLIMLEHVYASVIALPRMTGCMLLGCPLQNLQGCQQAFGPQDVT